MSVSMDDKVEFASAKEIVWRANDRNILFLARAAVTFSMVDWRKISAGNTLARLIYVCQRVRFLGKCSTNRNVGILYFIKYAFGSLDVHSIFSSIFFQLSVEVFAGTSMYF